MAKKNKAKKQLFYELTTGERFVVVGENGKYILCADGVKFRKAAERGKIVEEQIKEEPKGADAPADENGEG